MKPVPNDSVRVSQLSRDRVFTRFGRKRVMEIGIRDGDVWHVWQGIPRTPERIERWAVMERRHLGAEFDLTEQPVIDQSGGDACVSHMDDPVCNRVRGNEVLYRPRVVAFHQTQLEAGRSSVDDEDLQ
jgi:hypothetical protein